MLVYDHLTPVYRGKTGKGGVQGEGGGGQAFSLFLRIGGMFTYICLDSYYLLLSTRIINTFFFSILVIIFIPYVSHHNKCYNNNILNKLLFKFS